MKSCKLNSLITGTSLREFNFHLNMPLTLNLFDTFATYNIIFFSTCDCFQTKVLPEPKCQKSRQVHMELWTKQHSMLFQEKSYIT